MLAGVSAQAQTGTWNTTFSLAGDGTNTAVSIFATGTWTNGYVFNSGQTNLVGTLTAFGIGRSGFLGSRSGAWSMGNTNFTISPIGYATNITQGTSALIDSVTFFDFGGGLIFFLGIPSGLVYSNQVDEVAWVLDPSPAEFEIDLAFTNFTPGSYNTTPTDGVTFNMEVVPEPSTYALLALSAAGLGGYVLRRRRK
jgi:hypothetical protein